MMRLVSLLLAITCIFAAPVAQAQKNSAAPIEISITSDKPLYRIGEPIALTVELRNTGAQPITIVHPDYFGVTEIEVRDSSGNLVEPETFKGKRKTLSKLLTLAPGEKKSHVFQAMTAWTCCYGYRFDLQKPGRYQVTLRVTNPPVKTQPPAGYVAGFTGTLTAAPLAIEIAAK